MSFAILQLNADPTWPLVEGWYISAEEAVEVARRLQAVEPASGRVFRAVETSNGGYFRSLTGESLYV